MKTLSILLSMVNTVVWSLILLSCVSYQYLHWEALARISGRVFTGFVVILIGILTFWDGIHPVRPEKMLVSGLMLVLLGASSAAWGIHLSLNTGDLKKVFLIYGGSLVVQGITSIGGTFEAPDSAPARNDA